MKKVYEDGVQFLVVSSAKEIGLDNKGRVARLTPMEMQGEGSVLTALLVYSVVEPSCSRYERLVVDASAPVSMSGFLAQAWSADAGLGMPRRLEVKASLKAGIGSVEGWLAQQGVALVVASSAQGINGFERTSREVRDGIVWRRSWSTNGLAQLPRRLAECNAGLQAHDRLDFRMGRRGDKDRERYEAWKAREKRFCGLAPIENDWDASVVSHKAVLD